MAFVLTLLYVAISLVSPAVFPTAISSLHVNIILGVLTIVALLPILQGSKLGSLPDTYLVLGILFAAILSTIPLGFSSVPGVFLDYFPIFIVFYFFAVSCKSLFQLKVAVYVLLFVAFYIFAQGIMADRAGALTSPYLLKEGVVQDGSGAGMIIRYRGLGVLADPNDLALFFVTLIPLLWLRWKPGNLVSNVLFTIVPALILATGMFYTHSRGGAFALVALILFGLKDKMGVVLSSVLAAAMFFGLLALNVSGGRGMDTDDGDRVALWSTGLELFKAHPVVGVGIGDFADHSDSGHTAHNSYVLVLAETGIIGYFCWMGAIVSDLTELGGVIRTGEAKKERKDTARQLPYATPQQTDTPLNVPFFAKMQPALSTGGGNAAAVPGLHYESATLSGSSGTAAAVARYPIGPRVGETNPTDDPNSDESLRYAAKVLRMSFVGLLTASFFLSRSFSMVLYIVLGLSGALCLMYRRRHPEMTSDGRLLMKRTLMFLVGSIVFLYLFIRIRGIHG